MKSILEHPSSRHLARGLGPPVAAASWMQSPSNVSTRTMGRPAAGCVWLRATSAAWRRVCACLQPSRVCRTLVRAGAGASRARRNRCRRLKSLRILAESVTKHRFDPATLTGNALPDPIPSSLFRTPCLFNPRPQFLDPIPRLRRNRQNLLHSSARFSAARLRVRSLPLSRSILVATTTNSRPAARSQSSNWRSLGRGGTLRVDQANAKRQRLAFREIRLDECRPACRNGFRNFRVSVAGQIGKDHLPACLARPKPQKN